MLLAAGESRRWGDDNKLLVAIDGMAMVRRVAETILKSVARPVIVVTGHEADAVEAALKDLSVSFRRAPDYAEGMSASLKAGIAALPPDCDGVLVCLGDMPSVQAETLDSLIAAHDPAFAALFPTLGGKRGNPVLLDRGLFAEIDGLTGDQGARALLTARFRKIAELPVDDPGIRRDIDRPDMMRDALNS